ncbi:MAG: coenzyme F420-0:L-glutamate ligase [Methanobrevibacter sp.]|jgi:coenzyme F420-0:L-glutamate ligase/coenzyme F420-1:gamma-L-glutamate ligase|nr:coenzyme F420-0:L-glutamate ligase [Candidatus Methanovirga aequatorialis]
MKIELIGLENIPIINEKVDLSKVIIDTLEKQKHSVEDGDVILIAETLISKSENNIIELNKIKPSEKGIKIAKKVGKSPELIESILKESKEMVAIGKDFIITETKHGFVCANAGIDESNVESGFATPIPTNPDESALKIRKTLENEYDVKLAIIITDTQGRAFRNGAVGVAIGSSGIDPLWKRKGEKDLYGRELQTTEIAIADELSAAASLIMGQANEGIPIVIIKGFKNFKNLRNAEKGIKSLLRPKEQDVFRK